MARGLNDCNFIGNLTRDPEMRYTQSGKAVCSITIAVNDEWKDADGNKQEKAEFIPITLFGKLGEIAGQYLAKGAQVYIKGPMRTEKYQDKQTGADKYSTKIVASEMRMLGGGKGKQTQQGQPAQREPGDDFDDDIPF